MFRILVPIIVFLALSCTRSEPNSILVTAVDCQFQLSPDSTVNFELRNADLGSDTISCFQFENKTNQEYYFLVDSFSNKITSTDRYAYLEGDKLENFRCSFGAKRRVFLPPKAIVSAYLFTSKSARNFDSSFVDFLFYDKNDSVLKVKHMINPLSKVHHP